MLLARGCSVDDRPNTEAEEYRRRKDMAQEPGGLHRQAQATTGVGGAAALAGGAGGILGGMVLGWVFGFLIGVVIGADRGEVTGVYKGMR